jgi:glucose-6-phosphate 1-dehydrogenase
MDVDSEEQSSERAELHFLAALVDELMKALLLNGVMNRSQLQAVEIAVSERIGTEPRNW